MSLQSIFGKSPVRARTFWCAFRRSRWSSARTRSLLTGRWCRPCSRRLRDGRSLFRLRTSATDDKADNDKRKRYSDY